MIQWPAMVTLEMVRALFLGGAPCSFSDHDPLADSGSREEFLETLRLFGLVNLSREEPVMLHHRFPPLPGVTYDTPSLYILLIAVNEYPITVWLELRIALPFGLLPVNFVIFNILGGTESPCESHVFADVINLLYITHQQSLFVGICSGALSSSEA